MALQFNPQSESGRTEHIISQFLLKSLHVILESRIPSLRPRDPSGEQTPGSRPRKRDKWFNLALGDRPAALENLNFWHRNVMDPMIIDVILIHEVASTSAVEDLFNSSQGMMETTIERWVVHYEHQKSIPQSGDGSGSYKKTYKKSIILLRSLYSTLRLLPAFRVFRQLTSSSQSYNFDISYKVSSFSEPFSRAKEEEMKSFGFAPVETPFGRLCVSVTYCPSLSDLNLEASTLLPPQIIMDYVGSPAADPLKVFPSTGGSGRSLRSTSFPLRGFESPSSSPFQRPHSWTSGLHRAAHLTHQPFSVSPPTYPTQQMLSDFQPSPPDPYGQRSPNYRPFIHKKGISFDECRLSPPFSPSPSPSPPAYLSGGSPFHNRLRSETAPVSIPLPMAGRSTIRYLTPNSSDPNKHFLPPPSPRSVRADVSSQESPSESRYFRKLDAMRAGEFIGPKVFKDGKDDSGRFSGVVSSSGSPRIGFSRSSSRLSFQDDLDDCEFSCPFAVDDVDSSDSQTRTHSGKDASESTQISSSARQSQDAAVGMLVQMLRTAPPLRQDQSLSAQSSKSEFHGEVSASGFFPRKTADALEELRGYREMKDLLLSQSGSQLLESIKQRTK